MKAKIFIMTLLVMILSAVQGYAQRENRGNTRSRARVERPHRSTALRHLVGLRQLPVARQHGRQYQAAGHRHPGSCAIRHRSGKRPGVLP